MRGGQLNEIFRENYQTKNYCNPESLAQPLLWGNVHIFLQESGPPNAGAGRCQTNHTCSNQYRRSRGMCSMPGSFNQCNGCECFPTVDRKDDEVNLDPHSRVIEGAIVTKTVTYTIRCRVEHPIHGHRMYVPVTMNS